MCLHFTRPYLSGPLHCSWQPSRVSLWSLRPIRCLVGVRWRRPSRLPWLLEGILGGNLGIRQLLLGSVPPRRVRAALFDLSGFCLGRLLDIMMFVILRGYSNRVQWPLTPAGMYNRRRSPPGLINRPLSPVSMTLPPLWPTQQWRQRRDVLTRRLNQPGWRAEPRPTTSEFSQFLNPEQTDR